MKKINEDYANVSDRADGGILSIFCVDFLEVKNKVTFDSSVVQGMHVSYWMEDDNVEERINNAFDILFEEVIKTRNVGKNKDNI